MDTLRFLVDFILHIDTHLSEIIANYGTLTYLILFAIIFSETGFVVTPFLPGDSLLFAAGALAGNPANGLNIYLMALLLIIAAISGNQVNYAVGRYLGPRVFNLKSRWIKREYLMRTQAFYEKHGGKTIVYTRFAPILRTFAPFVAGVGSMNAARFTGYNVLGGVLWVVLFLFAGYWFGSTEFVRNNFSSIVIAIILVSLIPALVEFIRHRKAGKSEAQS